MDINKIFEEELREKIQNKLKQYENKIYLDNKDIMKELNISSTSNLRKKIDNGEFDGLYEPKINKNEHYKWNKFKFFKWYFDMHKKAIDAA